jgi:hypothetical protein
MNKNLIGVFGIILMIGLPIGCGYWAWVAYSRFYDSFQRFVWDRVNFLGMVGGIFFCGLFVGMFSEAISVLTNASKKKKAEQERQKLKEEIKKELEAERQPPPPPKP